MLTLAPWRQRNGAWILASNHISHFDPPLISVVTRRKIILAAGLWDQIARAEDIAALHRLWAGSTLICVEQGHFGFRMAEECFRQLRVRRLLEGQEDARISEILQEDAKGRKN